MRLVVLLARRRHELRPAAAAKVVPPEVGLAEPAVHVHRRAETTAWWSALRRASSAGLTRRHAYVQVEAPELVEVRAEDVMFIECLWPPSSPPKTHIPCSKTTALMQYRALGAPAFSPSCTRRHSRRAKLNAHAFDCHAGRWCWWS